MRRSREALQEVIAARKGTERSRKRSKAYGLQGVGVGRSAKHDDNALVGFVLFPEQDLFRFVIILRSEGYQSTSSNASLV